MNRNALLVMGHVELQVGEVAGEPGRPDDGRDASVGQIEFADGGHLIETFEGLHGVIGSCGWSVETGARDVLVDVGPHIGEGVQARIGVRG